MSVSVGMCDCRHVKCHIMTLYDKLVRRRVHTQLHLTQYISVHCRVHLTDDLARIVHDFAEHYHDSWALTKVCVYKPSLRTIMFNIITVFRYDFVDNLQIKKLICDYALRYISKNICSAVSSLTYARDKGLQI